MKITIKTTAKEFEVANMLIAHAVKELESKPQLQKAFGVTPGDLKKATAFRLKVLGAMLHQEPEPATDTGKA